MNRSDTVVRLRSRGGTDPACAAATVTAHEGALELSTATGTRTLRTGTDVVGARFDDSVGLAGRLALEGPAGPVAILDLDEWVPTYVRASGHCRGGIEDALVWTGAQALADAAGLPVERGHVSARADIRPCPTPRRGLVLAASVVLSLAGVVLLLAGIAELAADLGTTTSGVAAVVMTGAAVVIWAEHVLRSLRSRRMPPGEILSPLPSAPVTRRFARTARLVLCPADGPLHVLAVRGLDRSRYLLDGPSTLLGVHRALVVTPPGATQPERVDLVDGLGRQVVRLPWDEWFGADDRALDRLAVRGVAVERVTGPSLGTAVGVLAPRSIPFGAPLFVMPGAFDLDPMTRLAAGAVIAPLALGFAGEGRPLLIALGALNGLLLFGPMVAGLLPLPWLERTRSQS